jgi:opacity protein-like surface antigen
MKILRVSLCFLLLGGLTATAQGKEIPKGTLQIGGDLDVSISSLELEPQGSSSTDTDTTTIDLLVLKYLSPNIGVGLTWNYELQEVTSSGSSDEIEIYTFGPAVEIHNEVNEKLNLFVHGAFVLASIEERSNGFDVGSGDGFGWLVGAGISYFLADNVSVNAGIDYTSVTVEEDTTNLDLDISGFETGVGISVFIY